MDINSPLSLNNLSFSVADATISSFTGMGIDWLQTQLARGGRGKHIRYYYDKEAGGIIVNVLTRKVVGNAVSVLSQAAKQQYAEYLKKIKRQKEVADSRKSARLIYRSKLIEDAQTIEKEQYGKMVVESNVGQKTIFAYDCFGDVCVDAFMMAIPVLKPVKYRDVNAFGDINSSEGGSVFESNRLVWYDTTALVSLSSDKKLILTDVQGRDYSRKELVSNGDLTFSISGHICSDLPDVYPEAEVKKFYQIMRYKGVIEINNQFLNQFGVSKIVVKSFSLPTKEGYKSMQDYSFECVGIQPDKETIVTTDTIGVVNDLISTSNQNESEKRWSKLIDKHLDTLKDAAVGAAGQGLALATGYLDSLLDFD